jgi:hypothetical protein
MKKLVFTMSCLPYASVIMAITCVPLIKLLCQAVMGWIFVLEYLLLGMRGSCGHVLSYHTVNATTS